MGDLFPQLDEAIKGNALERVLELSNQILASTPGDVEARQCRVVALAQLGKYDEVLAEPNADDLAAAYCLYKLRRYSEALARAQALGERGVRLRAQTLFKLGRFDEAVAAYRELAKTGNDEVRTNLCAALVAAGRPADALHVLEEHKGAQSETFEFAYNGGCAAAAKGDWVVAEHLLDAARAGAEEVGLAQSELDAELAPIRAQLGYVLAQRGGVDERSGRRRVDVAIDLHQAVLASCGADASAAHRAAATVAAANLVQLRSGKDADVTRHLRTLPADLGAEQRQAVLLNKAVALLRRNRDASESLNELEKEWPDCAPLALLRAAMQRKQHHVAEARATLERALQRAPSDAVLRALAALLKETGDAAGALAQLARLSQPGPPDVRAMLALTTAARPLPTHVLARCADPQQRAQLLLLCGAQRAAAGDARGAAEHYAAALELDRGNTQALVGFVTATSQFDPVRAEQAAEALPSVAGVLDVDVDRLETQLLGSAPEAAAAKPDTAAAKPDAVAAAASSESGVEAAQPLPVAEDKAGKKKKRGAKAKKKRAKRPAKDMDSPVDPERWLPMKERSYYVAPIKKKEKRKGVKARIGGAGGHQGGSASGDAETALDLTAKKGAPAPVVAGRRRK